MSKNFESNKSNGSIELTDRDLAEVSGGRNKRNHDMKPVTFVVFTEGSTITGSPK